MPSSGILIDKTNHIRSLTHREFTRKFIQVHDENDNLLLIAQYMYVDSEVEF